MPWRRQWKLRAIATLHWRRQWRLRTTTTDCAQSDPSIIPEENFSASGLSDHSLDDTPKQNQVKDTGGGDTLVHTESCPYRRIQCVGCQRIMPQWQMLEHDCDNPNRLYEEDGTAYVLGCTAVPGDPVDPDNEQICRCVHAADAKEKFEQRRQQQVLLLCH